MSTFKRIRRCPLILALGALVLVSVTGCQTGPRMKAPIRAMWVTRYDYKTEQDVTQIIDDCKRANMNTVLFQVRGNGTAFYNSDIEPWADELGGADPGFDPLTVACREAHARNMELHAWVNVMPAWRGTTPPTDPEQLYNRHPDWFWYDQNGKRQELQSFYVSLNPCLPEVRDYIVDVFQEIVTEYDVDGLHMDYIRFPNEPPAIPRGSGIDYPRDERTLSLYKAETGRTPDDDQEAWNQWRTDKVTELITDIRNMMQRKSPKKALSASIGSIRDRGLSHYQDGKTWLERNLVDAAFLMNYTEDPDTFRTRIEPWLEVKTDAEIVPGLWFAPRIETGEGIDVVKQEIDIARETTRNFCIFAYSSMFESQDDQITQRTEKQMKVAKQRRDALLPYLNGLDNGKLAK